MKICGSTVIASLMPVWSPYTVYQCGGWDGHDAAQSGHDRRLLLHQLHHHRSVSPPCSLGMESFISLKFFIESNIVLRVAIAHFGFIIIRVCQFCEFSRVISFGDM